MPLPSAIIFVVNPEAAPDEWIRESLELRMVADITGRCPVCGARDKNFGIDYKDVLQLEQVHEDLCRVTDEAIEEYLALNDLKLATPNQMKIEITRSIRLE